MVKEEERRKKREALMAARAAGEDISEISSVGPSEKSGSKRSRPTMHGD